MTLEEAGKRFVFAPEKLEQDIAYGFHRKEGTGQGVENYRDKDFEQLALIGTLVEAGCLSEDIKSYLCLTEKQGTLEQQIRMQ